MRLPPNTTEMEIESSDLYFKVISEPHLCMLLNPNLTDHQIENIRKTFHVVQVEHNNTYYQAIILGYYKPKMLKTPEEIGEREARIISFWQS